jgi:hypothetical protein
VDTRGLRDRAVLLDVMAGVGVHRLWLATVSSSGKSRLELGAVARCSDGDDGPSGRLRWK